MGIRYNSKVVKNIPTDICDWCGEVKEIFTFNLKGEDKNVCPECWQIEFINKENT
jgi:hypothetical protein